MGNIPASPLPFTDPFPRTAGSAVFLLKSTAAEAFPSVWRAARNAERKGAPCRLYEESWTQPGCTGELRAGAPVARRDLSAGAGVDWISSHSFTAA